LQATLALNQAIQGELDPKLRELAYLKASQVNHCKYCLHYHTGLARKAGVSDVQVQTLEDYEQSIAYSDLEKLVIRFAEQWTQQGKVDAEVVSALSKSLSPSQLVVLAATVGLANWTNRFNETFGIALP
jgi:AhpD family alkylhydroperoxidase